jgi:hypothetical protein
MKRARTHAAIGALIMSLACASNAKVGSAPNAPHVDRPRVISRGQLPQLQISTMPSRGRPPIKVTIEVMIDETGRPVMSTFKVLGIGGAENRDALARWIEQSSFQPARSGGHPVAGVYHVTLEIGTSVR